HGLPEGLPPWLAFARQRNLRAPTGESVTMGQRVIDSTRLQRGVAPQELLAMVGHRAPVTQRVDQRVAALCAQGQSPGPPGRGREPVVLLTLAVAAVENAPTPAPMGRALWHSAAPTSAGCAPPPTRPPSAGAAHDRGTCGRLRCPHGPRARRRAETGDRRCAPEVPCDTPHPVPALFPLRRTAPAGVSPPPAHRPDLPHRPPRPRRCGL